MSHSRIGRFERGETAAPSTDFLGACWAAVGLELAIRAFPVGDPVRDRAHTALLARLRGRLHPSLRFRTEVPLPIVGDLRAWDAVIEGSDWRLPVEAETVVDDHQALERKLALKLRDGGFDHLILLVAATPRNRAALVATPMVARFPATSRAILAALRDGRNPGASGVVII